MPTRTLIVVGVVGYFLFVHKSTPTTGVSGGATVSPGGKQQPNSDVKNVTDTVNNFLVAAREIAGEFAKKSDGDGSTVTSA